MTEIIDRVGFAAGEIWKYLSENGESSPIKIKANLGLSNTMLYLALGWRLCTPGSGGSGAGRRRPNFRAWTWPACINTPIRAIWAWNCVRGMAA